MVALFSRHVNSCGLSLSLRAENDVYEHEFRLVLFPARVLVIILPRVPEVPRSQRPSILDNDVYQ